jgi:esterase/lipase
MYEYPGYGLCRNKKLTEEAIYHNIRKVYTYARNELNFHSEEIIVYGHSLGTGPSVDLAIDENYPVSAVILQAPFLSILRTVANVKLFIIFF